MLESLPRVETTEHIESSIFHNEIVPAGKPVVLKGLVNDWPAVQKALDSPRTLCDYINGFYQGMPIQAFFGRPETKGRYFYNQALNGFNYQEKKAELPAFLSQLLAFAEQREHPYAYMGSTYIPRCLPGFEKENTLALLDESVVPKIWISNQSRVAAHYDIPSNIACVISGKRRFTFFPPDQVENLYVGPLDFTPAGQSLSLVDFHNPDFEEFPRFGEAIKHAQVAELEPGDGIYIPSLWWHHVESLDKFNVLINYWWNSASPYSAHPFDALLHAVLAIRDLPEQQKQGWQSLFNHYVFNDAENALGHLENNQRGVLANLTPELARKLRQMLINGLNR